jgi:hypothetical protein
MRRCDYRLRQHIDSFLIRDVAGMCTEPISLIASPSPDRLQPLVSQINRRHPRPAPEQLQH